MLPCSDASSHSCTSTAAGRSPTPTSGSTSSRPAPGRRSATSRRARLTDMDRAVEAARKAFYETDWAQRPVEERAEMCERLAALIAEHREEFRDLIVDELGHTKFLADVYHSVAPTLHWNYYAKLGRNFKFAEVREADLVAAGRQRGRADHEVRDQEPGGARAGRRRRGAVRVQLPAAGHRAEDGAGAGRRLHRRGQGARPRPAGDLRDGRPGLARPASRPAC